MNICGILVHARPDGFGAVKKRLLSVKGVEVHGMSDEGRVVVTLEEENEDTMAESLLTVQRLEGVISASMIYHHNEEGI
ncbi:MAG: chaperone NapD [Gammaproteobacteria bacterium]|nr:chaperone NapD [Gammaproteobacteria bacterium]